LSSDSATEISATPRRSKRSSSSQSEPVELGHDHRLYLARVHQRQQPTHTGPL
jgi:hypothetical protein